MTRLFLSLYIFIALSLVGLSAGLERLFFNQETSLTASQQVWLNTLQNLQQFPEQLENILEQSQLPFERLTINQLGVADSIKSELERGQIVEGFDQHRWILYVPVEAHIIRLEIDETQGHSNLWWLYSSVFFALLAVAIAVWVYPLWRDLHSLTQATGSLSDNGKIELPQIAPSSPIAEINNALRELSDKVQVLLKNQRELTGAITHEFRTPLARLKFALADDEPISNQQLIAIRNDIDELESLVQEMLDFTRLDIHEPELHIESVPIYELCEQRIESIAAVSPVTIELCGDKPTFNADGHLIARAIDNLLSNAVRHARQIVKVNIDQQTNAIIVSVEDDGLGIPHAFRESIFDPFYRPDSARDRQSGGAGLGLAIVKRIQQWHGARCWAEDSALGGARFCLKFPQ